MPDLLVRSFAPLLLAFQPCVTRPSFVSFWALTCAWIRRTEWPRQLHALLR